MALTRLRPFLQRHRRIALDSGIFIYHVEQNPRYVSLTYDVFAWIARPGHSAVTSTITMTEILVQPYRDADEKRVNEFFALLSTYPNLGWIAPDLNTADAAARIRAVHRLRTPDALQAACAIQTRATGLIANDRAFERVPDFEALILDDLLDPLTS